MIAINDAGRASALRFEADGRLMTTGGTGGPSGGGDASAANQVTQITKLTSIDGKLPSLSGGKLPVTDPTALPLPNGASTAANQATGNASLSSIDGKLPALSGGRVPVALPSTAVKSKSGGDEYKTVAASQTDAVLGATGAAGDYIEGVLCVVSTAATSQVQLKDGSGTAFTILPNAVGAGVGSYFIPLGLTSTSGAWKLTTAAGVACIATGDFT